MNPPCWGGEKRNNKVYRLSSWIQIDAKLKGYLQDILNELPQDYPYNNARRQRRNLRRRFLGEL